MSLQFESKLQKNLTHKNFKWHKLLTESNDSETQTWLNMHRFLSIIDQNFGENRSVFFSLLFEKLKLLKLFTKT